MTEQQEIRAKYGGIERMPDTAQGPNYKVSFYPSYGQNGYSTYPSLKMFIHGCEDQSRDAIVKLLETIQTKTAMTLQVSRGGVRQSKQDDGEFKSYYWNIDRLLTIGGAAVKTEGAGDQGGPPEDHAAAPPEEDEPLFPPEPDTTEPTREKPSGRPEPTPAQTDSQDSQDSHTVKRMKDHVPASIIASWAINQAREAYQYLNPDGPVPEGETSQEDTLLKEVNNLALRFINMNEHLYNALAPREGG